MSPRKGDAADRKIADEAGAYAMLGRMPYGVIVHHEEGAIRFANPRAAELVGVASSADLIGSSIGELFAPPYLKGLRDGLVVGSSDGNGIRMHVLERLTRADGRVIAVELAAVPFLLEGESQVQLMFHEVAHEDEAPPVRPRASGLVMVVDGESLVRRAAQRVLSNVGYEVVEAGDGRSALTLFEAEPEAFACVLLDLRITVMRGEDVLIRMLSLRMDLPVVLLTGYRRDLLVAELMALGRVGFLRKPFGTGELMAEIERVCRM